MGKLIVHKHFEPKPLLPYVTLDEAVAFDPEKPETWTKSPFVNAVLEAMTVVRPTTARMIAKYLDLEERDMLSATRVSTGYTFLEFRYHLILRKLEVLKKTCKHYKSDKIAQELGFEDHSALSRFLSNRKTQAALEKNGPSHHAKPCVGRQKYGFVPKDKELFYSSESW